MRQEHALVCARIELLRHYPELNYHSESSLTLIFDISVLMATITILDLSSAQDLVSLYVRANNFDSAFSTGRLVGADLSAAFTNLTTQCTNLVSLGELACVTSTLFTSIRRLMDERREGESVPWLETDQTLAWDGSVIQVRLQSALPWVWLKIVPRERGITYNSALYAMMSRKVIGRTEK